jgi:hypothetical protein
MIRRYVVLPIRMAESRNDHSLPKDVAVATGRPLTVVVSRLPGSMVSLQVERSTSSRLCPLGVSAASNSSRRPPSAEAPRTACEVFSRVNPSGASKATPRRA